MRKGLFSLISALLLGGVAGMTTANTDATITPVASAAAPRDLALKAASQDEAVAGPAIASLREMGPAGLQALFDVHGAAIERARTHPGDAGSSDPAWQRVSVALDAVGKQKDCFASRLYWYTDLEQAKAAAVASGKPILSLRLLGNLDEEFSCANSRFFRTALYANAEVSAYLREHYVLHWRSVRPAPRVTIDFGDGRKLSRTLTGNSIHYVLDNQGRPVEALPGLYGPKAFLRAIERAEGIAIDASKVDEGTRFDLVRAYHADSAKAATQQWKKDLDAVGVRVPGKDMARGVKILPATSAAPPAKPASPPSARKAAPVAVTKSAVEMPILTAIAPSTEKPAPPSARVAGARAVTKALVETRILDAMAPDADALKEATDADTWAKIAALHAGDARLDAGSLSLVRCHTARACASSRAGADAADALVPRLAATFEKSIALDTVRNEYLLHVQIHEWFAAERFDDVEALNERVYDKLFLTPGSDPWLGLAPSETYTGLGVE